MRRARAAGSTTALRRASRCGARGARGSGRAPRRRRCSSRSGLGGSCGWRGPRRERLRGSSLRSCARPGPASPRVVRPTSSPSRLPCGRCDLPRSRRISPYLASAVRTVGLGVPRLPERSPERSPEIPREVARGRPRSPEIARDRPRVGVPQRCTEARRAAAKPGAPAGPPRRRLVRGAPRPRLCISARSHISAAFRRRLVRGALRPARRRRGAASPATPCSRRCDGADTPAHTVRRAQRPKLPAAECGNGAPAPLVSRSTNFPV